MEFDTFSDDNQEEPDDWSKICYAYDFVEGKHLGVKNNVEGLVYSDIDNIHAILLTREKTMPNISVLMDTLKETDVKERVSKNILLEALTGFEMENIDSKEYISEWKNKVFEESEMITKGTLKKILNMRKGIASKFNRYLHEEYGIWIDGELRKEEFDAMFKIGDLLNIKYEYKEDYDDGYAFVYYVGAKSKKLRYPNACCMRKVISLGDTIEYENMLPLMAVEFVRNSQYTVLPFPFKYLREYIEQC
jgi:flagellar hook-associated protein FlgK